MVVDHPHGRGTVGLLVGGVQEVDLSTDHVDGVVRPWLAQLPQPFGFQANTSTS